MEIDKQNFVALDSHLEILYGYAQCAQTSLNLGWGRRKLKKKKLEHKNGRRVTKNGQKNRRMNVNKMRKWKEIKA